ncbi:MAG: recombination-associated protein RdgC [Oceanospirillaceae bacterium]|nr:recombination-associated protein RdgC [Oceanospirillaceae bacterium]
MWFKNIIFYRFTEKVNYSASQLEEAFQEHLFTPCKSQELSRYGWCAPHPNMLESNVFTSTGAFLITAQKEDKLVPSSVVNQQLKDKVTIIEKQEGRKMYRKEKLSLKDEIVLDLLPRAFSKYSQTSALIVPQHGFIAVDSSSYTKAEELLNLLRNSLDTLPVKLPDVNHSPGVMMSQWLMQENLVPAFKCLQECELKDQSGEGATIKVKGQELQCDEITMHLDSGKQVSKLALEWDETLSFILHEDLSIKRFKPSEQLSTELNEENSEDPLMRLDSDTSRLTLELNRLLPQLLEAFGGEVKR